MILWALSYSIFFFPPLGIWIHRVEGSDPRKRSNFNFLYSSYKINTKNPHLCSVPSLKGMLRSWRGCRNNPQEWLRKVENFWQWQLKSLVCYTYWKRRLRAYLITKSIFYFFFMRKKHWIVHDTLIYWRNTFENYWWKLWPDKSKWGWSTISFAKRWLINLVDQTSKKTGVSFVTFQYNSNIFLKVVLLPNCYALPDYVVSVAIHI